MEVLNSTLWTADCLTVVGEEVESLVGVDHQVRARSALQTICTAGNGGKNVVGVHRPQDELAPVPELEALLVATLQPRGPALQAAHAHRGQVALPTLRLHWNARCCVLTWREEEGAVDQRIPLKDVHHAVAEDARHPVHLVGGEAGEDEAPGLVVADAALVLHLDVVGVDLGPRQHVERAVVRAAREDTSSAVVARSFHDVGSPWRDVEFCPRRRHRGRGGRSPRGGAGVRRRH